MLHQDDCLGYAPAVTFIMQSLSAFVLKESGCGLPTNPHAGCVACSWVVITALSALVCTGAVLGFVFLRGFAPSPYDAITISNSGSSTYASSGGGYAGNNGYHGYALPFLLLSCHSLGSRLMWGALRCKCLRDSLLSPPPRPVPLHCSPCTLVLPVALQSTHCGLESVFQEIACLRTSTFLFFL